MSIAIDKFPQCSRHVSSNCGRIMVNILIYIQDILKSINILLLALPLSLYPLPPSCPAPCATPVEGPFTLCISTKQDENYIAALALLLPFLLFFNTHALELADALDEVAMVVVVALLVVVVVDSDVLVVVVALLVVVVDNVVLVVVALLVVVVVVVVGFVVVVVVLLVVVVVVGFVVVVVVLLVVVVVLLLELLSG